MYVNNYSNRTEYYRIEIFLKVFWIMSQKIIISLNSVAPAIIRPRSILNVIAYEKDNPINYLTD
jgi:hypothetical protein